MIYHYNFYNVCINDTDIIEKLNIYIKNKKNILYMYISIISIPQVPHDDLLRNCIINTQISFVSIQHDD